jgi:hypothetical protein
MSNPTGKNQYSGSGAGNARNLTAKLLSNAAKKHPHTQMNKARKKVLKSNMPVFKGRR